MPEQRTKAATAHTRTVRTVRTASGQFVQAKSFDDPEVAQMLVEMRAKLTESPATAKAFLRKVGVINRSGKLSRNYGG